MAKRYKDVRSMVQEFSSKAFAKEFDRTLIVKRFREGKSVKQIQQEFGLGRRATENVIRGALQNGDPKKDDTGESKVLFELHLARPGDRALTRVVERDKMWVVESLLYGAWSPEFSSRDLPNIDTMLQAAFGHGQANCVHIIAARDAAKHAVPAV